MVPLWFHFPTDTELRRREIVDAFMFGPRYLAAPVLEPNARVRTVYLPTGAQWRHYYSRVVFRGGANVTVAAPMDELTLFERL
jgi:alpha-glucosidase (family GH31 glycosyl hydrolase)